ncbi:MAG: hypothetical protein ACR2JI_17650 [Mycobacterium sp.]
MRDLIVADVDVRLGYLAQVDLGYTVSTPAWSSMMFFGFGLFIRRRKQRG